MKAGDWPEPGLCSVGGGQAVKIMTGAPLPAGADAVVMVEHTSAALRFHPNVAKNATLEDGAPSDVAPIKKKKKKKKKKKITSLAISWWRFDVA